ncbi:MAG: hypothetical protein CL698_03835 [Chloroflexi bacterium]|nr:hypothetical protein [Chloroflexota bacterium]|tara:strand:- start:325 stop:504 length:180 start_codon:yes stop_codon:yes gene_type:complete
MDNKFMKKTFSRRSFLKGLPLAAIGLVSLGAIGGKVVASASRRQPPVFKKGSIFTPKKS